MEKIPTAEEFLKDKLSEIHEEEIFEDLLQKMFTVDISEALIEFAKLHVEVALKVASENAETEEAMGNPYDTNDRYYVVDKESILKSYPLENIK